ncbi:MAG TPA: 4Fe-4S dicluster domain-containing protein [Anaerolineales bacterium]|nr:4Fe-4S dicluster domain-containing protein [Anaerolineales bacterium]
MSLKIIQKSEILDFIHRLLPDYRVVGPVESNGGYAFEEISDPADLRLNYTTTILPPKKFLLPPQELLFKFDNTNGGHLQPGPEREPTVIFGVHTCDLHAIQLLDAVFTNGFADPNYLRQRQQTVLISVECLTPCDENSFCKSMGTLSADEGYDLHLTDLGDAYAVDIGSQKGEDLLLDYAASKDAAPEEVQRLNAVLSEKWPKFPYRLDFDVSDLPSLLSLSMKSPLWAELGERCLACAACTNVCPTCFCFDIKDEVEMDLKHGQRVRIWDSCQLDEFATVAGGHNFRKNKALRQRHRFLRKGKYILDAHQQLGCVGCGRCARACLVDITPVGVFNELYRQTQVEGKL